MATVLLEGFDKYGPAGIALPSIVDTMGQGGWSLSGNGQGDPTSEVSIVNGLSGFGQALQLIASENLFPTIVNVHTTFNSNYGRIIGGFRFSVNYPTDTGLTGIVFYDNTVAQCSIFIRPLSGLISIAQGNNGTVLATSSTAVAYRTVHYLEFDITFNSGMSGGWTIWLDGVQILSGTGATRQSPNNFFNVIEFSAHSEIAQLSQLVIDDFYLFDTTTANNNAALLANPIVLTQWPVSDQQTQFTNQGNIFGNTYSISHNPFTIGNNTLYLAAFRPDINCTINSIVLVADSTVFSANFKGVIYADSSGAPHSLMSSGTQVTGCTINNNIVLPLVSPQALTAGTQYWIGLITDTNFNVLDFDTNPTGFTATNTYASGAPSIAPAMTPRQPSVVLYGLCTGASYNWASENINPPAGDASSVTTATPGTTDLYNFPYLPSTVTSVYSVVVSANARIPSAGSHTLDLELVSGLTGSTGSKPNQPLTTSYIWYDSAYDVDPNTTSSWTVTAVNVGYYGMKAVT